MSNQNGPAVQKIEDCRSPRPRLSAIPRSTKSRVSLRFLKGFQLSVRILREAEARCSREIGPLDRGLNVFPRSSKLD